MTETLAEKELDGDEVRVLYREDAVMSFVLEINGNRITLSNRPQELVEELEQRYGDGPYEKWFEDAPFVKDVDTFDLI